MILLETVEWDTIVGYEGEICIIIKEFERESDAEFFDFQLLMADGATIDVWIGEIRPLGNHE